MAHIIQEKRSLTDLLVQSLQRPCFTRQRYMLSDEKERDLFMAGLLNKVDRLESCRLSNQDADPPRDELDDIFNCICKAERKLDNQRASFTSTVAV